MNTTAIKEKKTRSERSRESAMKNMHSALPELTMEQFAAQNMRGIFGREREEYPEKATEDNGNGYRPRSLQSLMKKGDPYPNPADVER